MVTEPGQATLVSWRADEPEAVVHRLAEQGVVVRDLPGTGSRARLVRLLDERRARKLTRRLRKATGDEEGDTGGIGQRRVRAGAERRIQQRRDTPNATRPKTASRPW